MRVFGRDETKQFYQRHRVAGPSVRFLIGDIRDRDRMLRACEGIDTVFHCAALKHVESGEYNPFEATQTNVLGTQNVIDACLGDGFRTMILTSTDKAANPTSVMDAPSCWPGSWSAPRRTTAARTRRLSRASGSDADDVVAALDKVAEAYVVQ